MSTFTVQDVVNDVRDLVQDSDASAYRYSDLLLTRFVVQTLRRMAVIRPDIFVEQVTVTPTADSAEQTLDTTAATRLVEVIRVDGGDSIEEVDRNLFNRTYPNWADETSGVPVKYMRHPRNPLGYYLYPPPQAGVDILVEYTKTIPSYDISDTVDLNSTFFTSVVDGVVFLVESIDNEHVNSNRAKLFYETFIEGLQNGLSTRVVTDVESGGIGSRRNDT